MLNLSKDAASFLRTLPAKQYKQVASRIFELVREPNPHDAKHLTGKSSHKRVDCGEYRVIYSVDGEVIYIPVVGKRNDDDVYRNLDRKLG